MAWYWIVLIMYSVFSFCFCYGAKETLDIEDDWYFPVILLIASWAIMPMLLGAYISNRKIR